MKCILVFIGLYAFGILLYLGSRGNTRDGEEHGSAKWGTPQELKQKTNFLLSKEIRLGMDTHKHRRNLNVFVLGGSGAGKTRFVALPNILEANCSYVITDPKGEILANTGYFLKEHGYDVHVFNLVDFNSSDGYNPFRYLRDDKDVLKLITNLIRNTTPKTAGNSDPFWEKAETALLEALISYHVGYFVTPLFHYYGVINAKGTKIVIGPTSQIMANEQELKELAFLAGVSKEDVPAFVNGMNGILRMPVETLLQMLCTMNHFLNDGEKLGLSDIAIFSDEQEALKSHVEERRTKRVYEEDRSGMPHNVLALENALMDLVRKGDVAALRSWLAKVPAVRGGAIAPNQLRQLRNTFIVAATLASRAAIRGGMREDDAFTLSDGYIQRVELLSDHSKIINLQYNMILEFTEQVEKLKRGAHSSKLVSDVANHIRHHLSEPISTERMADELYMSRPYLSARFKKETGETLTDFILREKTEEAKRLLRWSDRSASAVAAYLGFSSHSHFIRVFKKYAGVTPNEWRERQ